MIDGARLRSAATETSLLITAPWHTARIGTAYLYANGPTDAPAVATPGPARLIPSPNPFLSSTRISFVARTGSATLFVHDAAGRLVRRLHSPSAASGPRTVTWDGRDEAGRSTAAGIYFLRLEQADGAIRTGAVVRLR